jgi:hypothetical protein
VGAEIFGASRRKLKENKMNLKAPYKNATMEPNWDETRKLLVHI